MRQLFYFGLVGTTAALVNFLVTIVLVSQLKIIPEGANFLAFLVAFLVSYFGHRRFTFASSRHHREALPRFLITAILGFLGNETIFTLMIRVLGIHYITSLPFAILGGAIVVFLLGKFWSFKEH